MNNLLYTVKASTLSIDEIRELLHRHPEIKFVSLGAVDLGNNHTDERIPVEEVLENLEGFLQNGVQTDGSSVNLHKIAEINNAKVDLIPDKDAKWFVDYNESNIDRNTGKPVGTLIIPAFLKHDEKMVDSRSVLKRAVAHFSTELKALVNASTYLQNHLGLTADEKIERIILTSATELEFWVKTPGHRTDVDKLSTSQILKEQYWKRTVGPVRTAMEQSLTALNRFDFKAEMGHKEVGGVPSRVSGSSTYTHVMEQLEIDWRYDEALQSADNEMLAKDIIKETFVKQGLDVTFMAKPIEGVAGSGEHHHMGAAAITTKGRFVNLFAPLKMDEEFMNPLGFGALMGLLKNYEVVNPFVTATNDAFNRLKPGFEAPVCTVACLGHTENSPSRNRTVLVGLVRDIANPKATRFELRAPNPYSNTYLTLSASFQAMMDGMKAVAESEKSYAELLGELSKSPESSGFYLETGRQYRSEEDVFEHFSDEERAKYFGNPPATVWDNAKAFDCHLSKTSILTEGDVFSEAIIDSYRASIVSQWTTELKNRIIPNNMDIVRAASKCHGTDDITDLDVVNWERINQLRHYLMKDSLTCKSLFTKIREAIDTKSYDEVSLYQIEMNDKIKLLKDLYFEYKQNLLTIG